MIIAARLSGLCFSKLNDPMLSSVRNSLLNLAFPQPCHSCGAKVRDAGFGVACSECWRATSLFDDFAAVCNKCGEAGGSIETSFDCQRCDDHHYDRARSIGIYENALRSSLLHLKRVPVLADYLIQRINSYIERMPVEDCDLIVPVPLSPSRKTERGFNQAEVIARIVSTSLNKTLDSMSLVRKKDTPMHRAAMDRKSREVTVRNAFDVVRPKLVDGRSILLVDDIYTTGATVSYCAKALKKKGAARVNVFTLARARIGQVS